jgi:hypothetical protein
MMLMLALLQEAERVAEAQQGIGPVALTFMLLSMGTVTLLAAWCFTRILSGRRHFDPDGTGPAHSPVAGEVEREDRPPRR